MPTKKQLTEAEALAKTAYGEARGEKDPRSRLGVMYSVVNRQRGSRKGKTLWSILHEAHQYNTWDPNDPNKAEIDKFGPGHPSYDPYVQEAQGVLSGSIPDPTGGSEHYLTRDLYMNRPPGWAKRLEKSAELGSHVFLRNPQK